MTRIEVSDLKAPLSLVKYVLIGLAAFTLVLVLNKIVFNAKWVPALINSLGILVFPVLLAVSNHRRYNRMKAAFVSWNNEQVSYNTTKGEKHFQINEISGCSISFDEIEVKLKSGAKHKIALDIFSDVQDRNAIKNFFGQLAL